MQWHGKVFGYGRAQGWGGVGEGGRQVHRSVRGAHVRQWGLTKFTGTAKGTREAMHMPWLAQMSTGKAHKQNQHNVRHCPSRLG